MHNTRNNVWEGQGLAQQQIVFVTLCKTFASQVLTFVKQFCQVCLSVLLFRLQLPQSRFLCAVRKKTQSVVSMYYLMDIDCG